MSGGEKQYQLDAGQKRFGPTKCSECGVLYQMNVPEDENSHLIFHNGYKTLKFSVSKLIIINNHQQYNIPNEND